MDRIGSAKRKRESPDEDEVAEILETVELTRKVVSQVYLPPSAFLFGATQNVPRACLFPASWAWHKGCWCLWLQRHLCPP